MGGVKFCHLGACSHLPCALLLWVHGAYPGQDGSEVNVLRRWHSLHALSHRADASNWSLLKSKDVAVFFPNRAMLTMLPAPAVTVPGWPQPGFRHRR